MVCPGCQAKRKAGRKGKRMGTYWAGFLSGCALLSCGFAAPADTTAKAFPRVWMSTTWREPTDQMVRMCAEQGVDAVALPTWTVERCRESLHALRKYGVKGYTSSGNDPSENITPAMRAGTVPFERAVCVAGVYRGKAIDRTLFSFEPKAHDIIIEPPVYSARQGYTSKKKGPDGKVRTVRSGHYFGSFAPTGDAEIIVPEKPFDGQAHVRIIPCKVLPVEPGTKVEGDTVTPAMKGQPEIENRRLVRLRFDLTSCSNALLDKVGIAVYWASDTNGESWKKRGRGQLSVFSPLTQIQAYSNGVWRTRQWLLANGGTFPKDDIVAMRFGDECFNLTGWLDCAAASFPLWGFSPSGRAAFAAAAPGLVQPRTWGFPEVYGADAYGHALYLYHKACADVTRQFSAGVKSVAPSLLVFRNTTRGGVWCETNDHDGSGQELLARELDFIHLDPYPLSSSYNAETIPFDMGYMSGLARRFNKLLVPWMQGHSYAPSKLGHVTPAIMKRMWAQHAPYAPDAMMWLGFDMKPGKSGSEMTFPYRSPESWAYAKELFAAVHATPPREKPTAKLAVLRPYSTRALCCAQGAGWTAWRNPADRLLEAYVKAWSLDHGLLYDIFELPPALDARARAALDAELEKYTHLVSTEPYPRARIIGADTTGQTLANKEFSIYRKRFAAEIAALKAKGELK